MLDSVFDTNVLVAGLRSRRGASYQLLRLVPGLTVAEVDRFLNYLFSISNLEESVLMRRPNLRDPDDESILELAVVCKAMIVTHNIRDFAGADRLGVLVLTPSRFLKQMGESLA